MSAALDLVRAVSGAHCASDEEALALLETALEREVDPLLHIALRFSLHPALIMERAAAWCGFAYFDRVPRGLNGQANPARLEALAEIRLFRVRVLDRDVAFAAPDFEGLLRLNQRARESAGLRGRICLVPQAALQDYLVSASAQPLVDWARQNLARHWPFATAQLELTRFARTVFLVAMIVVTGLALAAPFVAQPLLLPFSLLLLLGPACIRWVAVLTPMEPPKTLRRPDDEDLPVYSVLIPLRAEAQMVPQLFASMRALDYPTHRLDIKFVVESRSPETVDAVRQRLGDPRFSLVVVPDAAPHTKPKALDFTLPLCRGEFVVVYDAEDVPDPDQLWKAVARFRDAPDVDCLQARLVIVNGSHNWLTALFSGEYAGIFEVLLPALAQWRLPMPLGGTSNHFRIAPLRALGGWDAYNVTEDADLGVRLARKRLRVEMLASATQETAHVRYAPWLGQRTRWMKGWMQTFIVHNRDPLRLIAEMGLFAALVFEVLVIGMILAPFLHVGFVFMLALQVLQDSSIIHAGGWSAFYFFVLLLGYGSAFAMTGLGLWRQRRANLIPASLLLPVYWLLIALATVKALKELLVRPFYWFKSPHQPLDAAAQPKRAWQLWRPRRSPGRDASIS